MNKIKILYKDKDKQPKSYNSKTYLCTLFYEPFNYELDIFDSPDDISMKKTLSAITFGGYRMDKFMELRLYNRFEYPILLPVIKKICILLESYYENNKIR